MEKPGAATLSRRDLLAGVAAATALPALPAVVAGASAVTAPVTIHIVDGWVLTSVDLKGLGLHAR